MYMYTYIHIICMHHYLCILNYTNMHIFIINTDKYLFIIYICISLLIYYIIIIQRCLAYISKNISGVFHEPIFDKIILKKLNIKSYSMYII